MNKNELVHAIAELSCDVVDMKTLLQMYYDDTVGYMNDLELEELREIANDMGIKEK